MKDLSMNRREFLALTGGVIFGASGAIDAQRSALARETEEASERPNVVLIMTDDQGYGDLGFHGNDRIETPNLDALARESVQFKHFYVCPVCSPTRASLMTGR